MYFLKLIIVRKEQKQCSMFSNSFVTGHMAFKPSEDRLRNFLDIYLIVLSLQKKNLHRRIRQSLKASKWSLFKVVIKYYWIPSVNVSWNVILYSSTTANLWMFAINVVKLQVWSKVSLKIPVHILKRKDLDWQYNQTGNQPPPHH